MEELLKVVLDLSGGNGWNNSVPFRKTGVPVTNNNKNNVFK